MVIDVAEQDARTALVNDQPKVASHPDGPEVLVPCLVELVEAHPRIGGVKLQIEGGRLDRLLFLACEACEAVRECVSDQEFHSIRP